MVRGLGKALQKALDGKEEKLELAPAASPLLNPHRRRIFEYLCLRPFQTNGGIAADLRYSPSSVSWHLRSLVASGYVAFRDEGGIFYPKNFVDTGDQAIFTALQSRKSRELLRLILDSPGISQAEAAAVTETSRQTAGKAALRLEKLGLTIRVQDGRYVRWYPTDLLREKQDTQRAKSRAYVDWLLKKLEDERQNPEVLRRTEIELQVRIGRGRDKGVLSLPLDPYGAIAR